MLSVARSVNAALPSSRKASAALHRKPSGLAGKSKLSPAPISVHGAQKRHYARWSKIVSRMSPAALAKMREGAMQSTRKPPTAGMTIQTSNTVVDPWLQPRLTNPFSSKFWTDAWNWIRHTMNSYIGSPYRVRTVCNQLKIEKFTRSQVRAIVAETYEKYNKSLASFHLTPMQAYSSESVMQQVRRKFGKASLPENSIPLWEAQNLNVSILNYVVAQIPAPLNLHLAQVTVRVKSNQKFVVKDKKGQILLGADEFKPVDDIWVLEKIVEKPENPWYIVATSLEHPDDVKKAEIEAAAKHL